MEIEIKLEQLLLKTGMKQVELANAAGLTQRSISELKNNKVERVSLSTLCKIAEVFGIEDIRELIDFKKSTIIDLHNKKNQAP